MYLRGRHTCIYTHNVLFLLYPVAMWLLIIKLSLFGAI